MHAHIFQTPPLLFLHVTQLGYHVQLLLSLDRWFSFFQKFSAFFLSFFFSDFVVQANNYIGSKLLKQLTQNIIIQLGLNEGKTHFLLKISKLLGMKGWCVWSFESKEPADLCETPKKTSELAPSLRETSTLTLIICGMLVYICAWGMWDRVSACLFVINWSIQMSRMLTLHHFKRFKCLSLQKDTNTSLTPSCIQLFCVS